MSRDIDAIIEQVQATYPQVRVEQLKVPHPADDDGIWFFTHPQIDFEVQLESPYGMCPFLIETNEHDERAVAKTQREAIKTLTSWLKLEAPNCDCSRKP